MFNTFNIYRQQIFFFSFKIFKSSLMSPQLHFKIFNKNYKNYLLEKPNVRRVGIVIHCRLIVTTYCSAIQEFDFSLNC